MGIDSSEVKGTGDDEKYAKKSAIRARKKDPLSFIGLAAVVILLAVAVAMFARQRLFPPEKDKSSKPTSEPTATTTQPITTADSNLATTNIEEDLDAFIDNASTDLAVPLIEVSLPDPAPRVEGSSEENSRSWDDFPIPPAPPYALPKPQTTRPRIPVSTDRQPYMTLRSGVEDAFDAYEETLELQKTAEKSKSDTDRAAYEQSMGRTLALLQHVHGLATEEKDSEQVNSMRYLLTYLYYTAGHLPEAIILGEAVARWGDLDDQATREAAMIALAAAQEASDTQWGINEQVGELEAMQSIAELVAERWPKDEQLDLIRMNLGYLYEAYNLPERAIQVYRQIPVKSKQHAEAQIASGMAAWRMARRRASEQTAPIETAALRQAQQLLRRGLAEHEKDKTQLDASTIDIRLALAQIALLNEQPNEAIALLTSKQKPIIDQIRVADGPKQGNRVAVSEYKAKQLFDAMYYAHRQLGDPTAANQILEQLVATVDSVEIDLEARLVSTIKQAADRLKAKPVVTSQDVDSFAEVSQPMIDDEQRFPTENLLWLGETWGRLSEQANDTTTQARCAAQGAEIYLSAISRTDFPSESTQSAQLRRIELLRRSGNLDEAIQSIEEVLSKTPNVFALQIAAAQTLQDIAGASGKPSDLQAAVNGPPGFSSIWGWGKLVSTLYATRWSASGTDKHAAQLLLTQFNLAQCQMLLALQTTDTANRRLELANVERSLQRVLATMEKENPWTTKFEELSALVKKQK